MDVTNKTIFDFCTEPSVLQFITGSKQPLLSSYLKSKDQEDIWFDLSKLAYITNNDALGAALFEVFPAMIDWTPEVEAFAISYRMAKE